MTQPAPAAARHHRRPGRRGAPARGPTWGSLVPALVILVALALPAVAALASALRRPWLPASDWALIELRVRDVGTADTPLVGAYSRFGWNHPGPWGFYLLAVPYRLLGPSSGLLGAAALWNIGALAAFVAVVRRGARSLAVIAVPVLALLVHALGAGFLNDPWNPSLPVLAVAVLVVVGHRHALGDRWTLPALAALGSLIVQCHVGLAPVTLAVGGAAIVARRLVGRPATSGLASPDQTGRSGPGEAPARGRRWTPGRVAVATAAVVVVAWAPVVLEQLTNHPGNLTRIARDAGRADERLPAAERERIGAGRGAHLFARQFGLPAPWTGAEERAQYFDLDHIAGTGRFVDLLPLAVLGGAALVTAGRRRDGPALALLSISLAGALGGLVTLVAIRGEPYGWLVRGLWPVAALLWTAIAWALARAVAAARPALAARLGPVIVVASFALVAGLGIATSTSGTLGERRADASAQVAARLAPETVAAFRGSDGVMVLPGFTSAQETWALAVALDRAGIRWTDDLDEAERRRFPDVLTVAKGQAEIDAARRAGHQVVARARRVAPAEQPTVVAVVRSRFDGPALRDLFGPRTSPPR